MQELLYLVSWIIRSIRIDKVIQSLAAIGIEVLLQSLQIATGTREIEIEHLVAILQGCWVLTHPKVTEELVELISH